MRKLSKAIYNNNIGDRHAVKALALFVFVKENKPTSVFTDYTITSLAEFASLSRNTTRNRIKKLEEMGLVERVGKNEQHLLFKRARAKCANVNLSKIKKDNVKNIELGLKALLIYVSKHGLFSDRSYDEEDAPKPMTAERLRRLQAIFALQNNLNDNKFHKMIE